MVVPIGANLGQKKIRSLIFSKLRICLVAHSGIESYSTIRRYK